MKRIMLFFCSSLVLLTVFLCAPLNAVVEGGPSNISNTTEEALKNEAKNNSLENKLSNLSLPEIKNNLIVLEGKFIEYDKNFDRFLNNQQDVCNKIIITLLAITAILVGASVFNNVYLIRDTVKKAEESIRKEFAEQIKIIKTEIKESSEAKFKKIEDDYSLRFVILEKNNSEALGRIDEAAERLRKEFKEQINNVQAKISESTEVRFKESEKEYSKEFQRLRGLNHNALGRIYHENKSYFLSAIWYARGLKDFIATNLSADSWIKLQIENVSSNLKKSERIEDPKDIAELYEIINLVPSEEEFKEAKNALQKIFEENIAKTG